MTDHFDWGNHSMNRLAKNSIAAGLTTLLVTTGLSFAANGAEDDVFTTHAESRFLAGTSGIAELTDAISRQIEGEEADCTVAAIKAGNCPVVAENSDISIPLGVPTGITLGAIDNFASASADGTSRASSGVVGDNGFIDTDAPGEQGSVTINIADSELGVIGENLADLQATLGAVSAQADLDASSKTVARDYNIASAKVTATLPVLTTINSQLKGSLNGFNLLETLTGTDALDTSKLSELFPVVLKPLLDALGGATEGLLKVEAKFPSIDSLTTSAANFTNNGVTLDVSTGTVSVDLVALLATLKDDEGKPLSINNLPPETDILAYALPAIVQSLDTLIDKLFETVVNEIVSKSSVTVSLLGGIVPIAPITIKADQLDTLLDPLQEGLTVALGELSDQLSEPLDQLLDTDALGQVAQILVNNPDLYGNELVESDGSATLAAGDVSSETAVRVLLLDGDLADLRLANAVVGPNAPATIDNDDDGPGNNDGTVADGNVADGNVADGTNADGTNADGTPAASIADADSAADADVQASLPNAGAPNLLPFFLLGIALLAFGLAVLLNERRRLGIPSSDNIA